MAKLERKPESLILAGWPARRTLAAVASGRLSPAEVDEQQWEAIVARSLQDGMGPLLLHAVRQSMTIAESDPRWRPLITASRQSAIHYALLESTQRRFNAALGQAGILALWLKGIVLAQSLYPEPSLRPMLDLDVLIPPERREEAVEIAAGLGFQPPEVDYLEMVGAPPEVRFHDELIGGPGKMVCLEIHFRLLGFEGKRWLPAEDMTWFWEHTRTCTEEGGSYTILEPEAHLLYLCAHTILQHGEGALKLLHLYDLHLLAQQERLDWELIAGKALSLRWAYVVERALSLTREFFSTPVPEDVLAKLHAHPYDEESAGFAIRMQGKVERWEEWKSIFRNLPPAQRARLIWNTLFPPPALIRDLYSLDPSQPVLPCYFTRWLDRGREIGRSLQSSGSRRLN